MQTRDVLDRWREPAAWRRPGRVALANTQRIDPAEPMHAALLASGAEVLPVPLGNAAVADSDVVVSGGAPLDAAFFAGLRATRLLLRPYVGYDDIDVAAATAAGVLLANVPDAIDVDVANQAMALILAANRELLRLDAFVRDGSWARIRRRTPDGLVLHRPEKQTLGFLGFGRIAWATARRAEAFGFRMIAHDPYADDEAFDDARVEPV
jgi:D-3-phosphoglycerate dehydrogenase